MTDDRDRELLEVLRDIRDDQRQIVALLQTQRTLAEEQLRRSRDSIEESVGLQRLALERQRHVALIAVPGILACIGAIMFLVWRYL
jgi:hypothetical protein